MTGAARFLATGVCLAVFAGGLCGTAAAQVRETAGPKPAGVGTVTAPDQKHKAWDGNRTTPAHLITLKDENNELIVPTERNPLPFSARFTCGPCHDYDTVRGGWHWNAMTSKAGGRPGEPWIWLDAKTGTVLPLSYRKWPGLWDPRAVGLNAWDFTRLFGRHFPGGGPAEPDPKEAGSEADSRWEVSGTAEANCLACHNKSGRQDHSEWAKQVLRQNLRWAATAAGGVGEVGGMASRLRETWDIYDGPNPDDREWAVVPSVKYRTVDFDGKHRYFFDIAYPPDDRLCLVCHSVSPVKETRAASETDVHAAAGIKCAECHRNDLGHAMVRGYEGEAKATGNSLAESFTCRGCHLGESADGTRLVRPGRMGAPYPKHAGIPLVHFKTLSCTVCHSGPMPEKGPTRVRTSRANRLGIYGVAQWSTDLPVVGEPVFVKDADSGKIGPRRLVWPAFWAGVNGKNVVPLQPGVVETAAGDVLRPEERIAATLIALGQAMGEDEAPVLVSGKWFFEANVDGGLDAGPASRQGAVGPAVWSIKKGVTVAPLIPDFDPASPEKDPEIEPKILSILQALGTMAGAPGPPAVLVRKTLYQIKDGNLDMSDAPEGLGGTAGCGWLKDGRIVPLASDFEVRTVTVKAGTEQTLTEEQVALVLKALAEAPEALQTAEAGAETAAKAEGGPTAPAKSEFAYVSAGYIFTLGRDGRVEAEKSEAAAPVTWPLAHNVRPVQQSLGWKGCSDCHTAGSKFFFGAAEGTGPLITTKVDSKTAASFMHIGGLFHRVFGLTFAVRPFAKIVLGLAIVITGVVLLAALVVLGGRLAGLIEKRQ